MADIIIFSTTTSLTHVIEQVLKRHEMAFPVYEATMEQAQKIAQEKISKGTRVVISRGGTAEFLRAHLSVPVISIQHSFYDIHAAVQRAKQLSDKIAVIGYDSLCTAAEYYKLVMNYDFMYICRISSYNEYEIKVLEMVTSGVRAMIGGISLEPLAKQYHISLVAGGGSEGSVENALQEAMAQLRIENERRKQNEILNAVINSTSEGIIGFENNGAIIHINYIAKRQLNYHGQQFVQELLPDVHLVSKENEYPELNGELIRINHRMLALTTAPILVGASRIGTVATLQERDYIQMVDRKIRKVLLGRGHVAKNRFSDIVGHSKVITTVKQEAMSFTDSNSTVLIMGETGVGKEMFAQSIHNYSSRSYQPFVAINCAALPQNILESELFGYVKGAFTGARSDGKTGIFELAHTGTVFLDEISELSLDVQAKLLRVIQEKELIRVGDDKTIPIDVRIIAACNANLLACVNKKTFRSDLYYRIAVLELYLPPLRARREDIADLIEQIIEKKVDGRLQEVTPEAMTLLTNFDWPGNVRQLINIIERLDILCVDGIANQDMVVSALHSPHAESAQPELSTFPEPSWLEKGNLLADSELELIRLVLRFTGGNRERASAMLGISPTTLWRKIKSNPDLSDDAP